MIDLHIHTTYSDGTNNVTQILKMAQELRLNCISITDHNTIEAYEELENLDASNYYSGNILIGCEINTSYKKSPIEFLAYGFDYNSIRKWLEKYFSKDAMKKNRLNALRELENKLIGAGLIFNKNLQLPESAAVTEFIIDELKKYPENLHLFEKEVWETRGFFYRRYVTNPDSAFFLDDNETKPSAEEIIEQIHLAGGKVFLAHLYAYYLENHEAFLQSIIGEHKLDGIECYHWTHNKEQTNYLVNFCEKNKLLVSGGSDYHGSTKPWINVGTGSGNLNIPDSIVTDMFQR